jgi:hypothetical protein
VASWNAIAGQVEIINGPPKFPDAGDLDLYESRSGFLLPLDYREFILTFGIGWMATGTSYWFAVPGFRGEPPTCDPTALTAWFRRTIGFDSLSDESLAEHFDDPRRARRMLLFTKTDENDFYGWDPEDVTDPAGRECGIYLLGRYDTRVRRVATTFREFILSVCFEGAIKPDGSGYVKIPDGCIPDDDDLIMFFVSPDFMIDDK